jgi:outer membrane protein TolC
MKALRYRRAALAALLACAALLNAAGQDRSPAEAGALASAYQASLARLRLLADFGGPAATGAPATGAPDGGAAAAQAPGARATGAVPPSGAAPAASAQEPYGLAELQAIMAQGNPAAAMAAAAVRAAGGELSGAKGARLPSLSGSISGAYLGNPQDAISIPMGAFSQPPAPLIPDADVPIFPAVDPTQYSFKLTGEQPLFTWGKIRAGVRSAEAGLNAARLAQEKTEHENAIWLQANYESLAYLAEAEAAMALQKQAGARLSAIAEQNLKSGFITDSDYLAARIKVKEIDLGLAVLVERRERLLAELSAMTGIRDLRLEQLSLAAPIAGSPIMAEDGAADAVAAGSYDLALASAFVELKAELQRLAQAQARSLPDLGLSVELSYAGSRFPFLEKDWDDKGDYQLIIGLGASGRLLGDAVKAGALEKARAELDEALARREDAQRRIRSFVRESYLGINLAQARLEYALLKQESFLASLAQKERVLSLGAGSESDYLSLLMEALGGLAEAYGGLAEYRGALLSLEAAAGKR